MPELPEVETVRTQLLPVLKGRTITSVEVFHSKTIDHNAEFANILTGKTMSTIERVGKLLIFSFLHERDLYMLAHLKMTGQFFYSQQQTVTAGGGHSIHTQDITDLPNKHTRVTFELDDRHYLHFNDMRLFGYIKLVDEKQMNTARKHFGPEPIHKDFPVEDFVQKIRKRKTTVKAALLDQTLIAGLGNIYVDEALFKAKIRPTRRCYRLSKREVATIAHQAGEVMRQSIHVGGTTFQHFLNTTGGTGNYTDQLKVFGKQGTLCQICATPIQKTKVAGRGTHYCPHCQT